MAKRRKPNEREILLTIWQQVKIIHVGDSGCCVMAGIICPICERILQAEDIIEAERDHMIPLELGGEDDATNWAYVHARCHREKTAKQDIPRIAKAKRVAGETGQQARRKRRGGSSIKNRGFETNRTGLYKTKFDGTTERRQP